MMTIWIWVGFIALIVSLLALDLGVLNRKAHAIGVREAAGWTALWIGVALIFNVAVYFMYEYHWLGIGSVVGHPLGGRQAAILFFTGYVIEESLSLDNMFVIALIFTYFQVPRQYQHRVLFWGIVGAMVMRGIMIGTGTVLIRRFAWMIYVFGALLLLTAVKLLFTRAESVAPDRNLLVRAARKLYPVSPDFEKEKFFTRLNGRRGITPLFLVLLVVESTDVVFAVDSIPAIFAVTNDPFIIFTSNVFAIMGLRSLYFVLAAIMSMFRYLKISLVFVLGFVGVKMLISRHYHIPAEISLGVVIGVLVMGVLASVVASRRERGKPAQNGGPR